MKNKFVKALAVLTVSSVLGTNVSYAASDNLKKSETIYVTVEDGKITDQTASVWLNSDKNIKAKDKSNLKDIKNLETDQEIKTNDGYINWNEKDEDIYYQGKSDQKLPVDVKVTYYLDGKEISSKDLEGKSGHLKIVASSTNNISSQAIIDGKEKKVYSPYAVVTVMSFDSDKVTNIEAADGKIVKDGKNDIVTGLLTPGLRENLTDVIKADKLDRFKETLEIEMDVTDYKLSEIYAVITNEFFQEDNNLASLDDLNDGIGELESNIDKLVDAGDKLNDGGQQLNDGLGKFADGSEKLSDGSTKLVNSYEKFANVFKDLPAKTQEISGAVTKLNQGGSSLNAGIGQYTEAVSQINANMDKLNRGANDLDQGAGKLDAGLGELSEATGMLREKTSAISGTEGIANLGKSLVDLQTGLDDFGKNVKPLANGLSELDGGLGKLEESSASLSQGIEKLNQTAQNSPSVSASVEDIIAKATAIEGIAASLESKDVDGSYADEIYTLRQLESGLYAQAENLKASAQVNGAISQGLAGLNQGSKELNAGISQAHKGSAELSQKLNVASGQLEEASGKLAAGVGKLDQGLSNSDLVKLGQAIGQMDDATKELKQGSEKLKAGTSQNKEGVAKLARAMGQLDGKSSDLKDGSKQLSDGLAQFEERSKALSSLGDINEKAINPMGKGIGDLNNGIQELRNAALQIKEGSDTYQANYQEFNQGLKDYKTKGIDELSSKTGDAQKISDILDEMSKLAKENNAISGSTEDFETRSRIIEKIK